MKELIFFLIGIVISALVVSGENSIPLVKLESQMTISYQESDFYFKRPWNIKIADDGSIFLLDEKQFLKFDASGKYLSNMHRYGEGPGESIYIRDYQLFPDKIIIYSSQPKKILILNISGNLLKEFKSSPATSPFKILSIEEEKIWTLVSNIKDDGKAVDGIIDIDLELCKKTFEGENIGTGLYFSEKTYLNKIPMGQGYQLRMSILVPVLFTTSKDGRLYVSNNQKYNIKQVDLVQGKIIKEFSAPFDPILYRRKPLEKGKQKSQLIEPDYFNDIQKIAMDDNILWVFTSKIFDGKGILVDRFSNDGEHIDRFYLKLPQVEFVQDIAVKPLALFKGFIFTVEKDRDENPRVVKYKWIRLD